MKAITATTMYVFMSTNPYLFFPLFWWINLCPSYRFNLKPHKITKVNK